MAQKVAERRRGVFSYFTFDYISHAFRLSFPAFPPNLSFAIFTSSIVVSCSSRLNCLKNAESTRYSSTEARLNAYAPLVPLLKFVKYLSSLSPSSVRSHLSGRSVNESKKISGAVETKYVVDAMGV